MKSFIQTPHFHAKRCGEVYALTFDPGGHVPQEISLMISEEQLKTLCDFPEKFREIIQPLMREQGVKVK